MRGKSRKKFRFLKMLLLLIMIVCLIPVGQAYYLSFSHEKKQEELRNLLETGKQKESEEQQNVSGEIQSRFTELYSRNQDLAGWLAIEGTDIDYPVMQCEDDEYYLNHNFQKEKDKYGCLYVRSIADLNTPGTNFIIYGHNMRDGSMFGKLNEYESEDFYRKHERIFFDTLYEGSTYEILSVFSTRIQEESEFKYYEFYQAETEQEFLDFYENIKKRSLYDTKVTAEFGDTFLTLSTCFGSEEDERFVVVAKKIVKIR